MPSLRPSPGIVAAGISAILGGAMVVLCFVFVFLVTRTNIPRAEQAMPAYQLTLARIVWGALIAGACYLVLCGVEVIRLRNWARISLLVFSGMMLFFGIFGVLAVLLVILASEMPGPPGTKAGVIAALVFVYGLPIVVAFWWLILLTRRSVVAQFQAKAAKLPPSRQLRFIKPGCPLPVSVVAWFLLSSVLSLAILPFLPFSVPFVLFGRILQGPVATALLLTQFLLIAAGSIGLLRLQRWSFPLIVATQLFYLANGLITLISPNYLEQVRTILAQMHLPPMPAGAPDFLQYSRYFGWFGLLVPIACLVALLYAREAFYAAASSPRDTLSPPGF